MCRACFKPFGCKTLCADNCFYRNICFNAADTRPIVKKKLTVKVEPTNADRCIGLIATVIEDINNIDGTGLVKVDGKIWTAKCEDIDRLVLTPAKRILTTGGHYAHLKIAEGCDKHCTYCIIPKLRGNYRSFPMERLVKEAEELAEQGVKELILVAQETTLYGTDLYGKKSLHLLLKELCKIKGIRWIRVQYCYPEEIYDELIQTIKEEPKVCHYLDLPIQHASDWILKRMGRRTSQADLRAIIGKLRQEIPPW